MAKGTKSKSAKAAKDVVVGAAAGVVGAATTAMAPEALEGVGLFGLAATVGGAKGLTKLSAEKLMELAGVFSDSPATRRLRVAGEAEMYGQLIDDHGPGVARALNDIPEGQRASELSTVFAATAEGWGRSAGAKKRRVLLAVLVNALQPEALEAGDAAHILRIVGRLDYGELHFQKNAFGQDDKLGELGKEQWLGKLAPGTEEVERLHRLADQRLVHADLTQPKQARFARRTWLGKRVLQYCGSDAFREDMPGED